MKAATMIFAITSIAFRTLSYKITKSPSVLNLSKLQRSCNYRTKPFNCIGTDLTPIDQDKNSFPQDSDNSWKTVVNPSIVPVRREQFTLKPELITFDSTNTLIEPSQSIGRWYREALNIACDMQIRLPRPAFFTAAFKKVYGQMDKDHPCFGATTGLTPEQWWYEVVLNTYLTTPYLTEVEPEEIKQLMPAVFKMLYHEVFSTKAGWVLKEDVEYTLKKLKVWRDQGAGPKLGVISNFDNRLPAILNDLGIGQYFNFIITSYDQKVAKPDKKIFEQAVVKAGAKNPLACYHIGDSIDRDVHGSVSAGWTSIRINENFDDDFPDWFDADTKDTVNEGYDRRMALMNWGRKDLESGHEWVEIWGLDDILQLFGFPEDLEKPIATTYIRGYTED